MARMIDRMRANGVREIDHETGMFNGRITPVEAGSDAAIIDVTNVARYHAELRRQGHEWQMEEFPYMAPPFRTFWMEFAGQYLFDQSDEITGVGVLFEAPETAETENDWPPVLVDLCPDVINAKWFMVANVFIEHRRVAVGPSAMWVFTIGDQGQVLDMAGQSLVKFDGYKIHQSMIGTLTAAAMFPCMLAISLMHCKNVTTEEVAPPPALAKAYLKRHPGAPPMVTYRTINITPMQKVIRQAQADAPKGTTVHPLHIIRGHFKTFDDRPLFGRHTGTYWWSPAVRGNVAAGEVKKDYRVQAPKEKEAAPV